MLGDNIPSDIRRGSTSSLIVVSSNDVVDSSNVQNNMEADISFVGPETSRLRYLLWPLVKLMTLLRFWRKPKEEESESEDDLEEDEDCQSDIKCTTGNIGTGKNIRYTINCISHFTRVIRTKIP